MISGYFSLGNDIILHKSQDCKKYFKPSFLSVTNLRFTTNKRVYSKKLSISEDEKLKICVVANARFSNERVLLKQLDIYDEKISSSEIILKAYKKWGKQLVNYLKGDWVFVLWDESSKSILLVRDAIGNGTLFFYHDEFRNLLVFNTCLKSLIANPLVSVELNENAILQSSSGYKRDAQTFYKNILLVPSGHTVEVRRNQKAILSKYWLPERKQLINYQKHEEYTEHFLDIYTDAVRYNVGKEKTALALSSGLDSGSLAVLLSPIFREQNRTLDVFSWMPDEIDKGLMRANRYPNEIPYVKKLVKELGNINLHIVRPQPNNLITSIEKVVDIFVEPASSTVHFNEVYEAAKKLNIETFITGALGNYTVSYQGDKDKYLRGLFKQFHWLLYIQSLSSIIKNNNWKTGLKSVIKTFIPRNKGYFSKNYDFVHSRTYLNTSALKDAIPHYFEVTPETELIRKNTDNYQIHFLLNVYQANLMNELQRMTQGYNMDSRIPLMDERLIQFLLDIPSWAFIYKGEEKYLFKKAFHGKLPNYILYNKKRGAQWANILSKHKKELTKIKQQIEEFKLSRLVSHWINISMLEDIVKQISSTSTKSPRALNINYVGLRRGLTFGIFLLKFENEYQ